jgi:hypothetical protein
VASPEAIGPRFFETSNDKTLDPDLRRGDGEETPGVFSPSDPAGIIHP